MSQFTYLLPALIFFVVFFTSGKNFLLATASIMLVMTVQVIIEKIKKGTVEKKLFLTWIALMVLGSATLMFRDPAFLQWKLTIVNWIFSLVLMGNQLLKRPPILKSFMQISGSTDMPKIPDKAWINMTYLWSFAFFFIGLINLYFVFYSDLTSWVNFKLFGVLGIMFFFVLINAFYLSRFITKEADISP